MPSSSTNRVSPPKSTTPPEQQPPSSPTTTILPRRQSGIISNNNGNDIRSSSSFSAGNNSNSNGSDGFTRRVSSQSNMMMMATASSGFSAPPHQHQHQKHPHSLLNRAQQQQSFAQYPHHPSIIIAGASVVGGSGGGGGGNTLVNAPSAAFGTMMTDQSFSFAPQQQIQHSGIAPSIHNHNNLRLQSHHHLTATPSFSISAPGNPPGRMALRHTGSKLLMQPEYAASASHADLFADVGGGGAQQMSAVELRARELERQQQQQRRVLDMDNMRDYLSDSMIQQMDQQQMRSPSRGGDGGIRSRRGSVADPAALHQARNNQTLHQPGSQFLNATVPKSPLGSSTSTQAPRTESRMSSSRKSMSINNNTNNAKPQQEKENSKSPGANNNNKRERRRFHQNDKDVKSSHVIETISVSELDKMKKLFDLHDVDKSGSIDEDELLPLLEELGHPMMKAQAIDLLSQVDVNGNGLLEFSEFLQLVLIFKNVAQFRLYNEQGGFSNAEDSGMFSGDASLYGVSVRSPTSPKAGEKGGGNGNGNTFGLDQAGSASFFGAGGNYHNHSGTLSLSGENEDDQSCFYLYLTRPWRWFSRFFPFNHESGFLWAWEVMLLMICIYIWCVVTATYAFGDVDRMATYMHERFNVSDIIVSVLILVEILRTCITKIRVTVVQEIRPALPLASEKKPKEKKQNQNQQHRNDDGDQEDVDNDQASEEPSTPESEKQQQIKPEQQSASTTNTKMLSTVPEITKHYLYSWCFLFDLLALLPLRAIITNDALASIICGHLRLFFLYHLKDIMSRKSFADIDRWFVYFFLSFAPIVSGAAAFVAAVHVCAIAAIRIDLCSSYAEAVYITLYSFSGAGLGDVEPQNDQHRTFYACLCIISMLVNGFVIGSIVSFFSSSDVDSVRKSRLVQTLAVLDFFQVPRPLQEEILQFQNHLMAKNIQAAFSTIVESLPAEMKVGLGLQVRIQLVRSVELFRMAHPSTQIALAQELFPVVLCPEEFVALAQEEGEEMFFISYGFVDVLTAGGVYIQTLKMYESFGAEVVLGPVQDAIVSHKQKKLEDDSPLEITSWGKYFTSAKTLTYVELLGLGVPNFDLILRQFPRFRKTVEYVLSKPNWAEKIFTGTGKKSMAARRKESILQTTENAGSGQQVMNPLSGLNGQQQTHDGKQQQQQQQEKGLIDVFPNDANDDIQQTTSSNMLQPQTSADLARQTSFNVSSSLNQQRRQSQLANQSNNNAFAASGSMTFSSHSRPTHIAPRPDVRGKLRELGVADLIGDFDYDYGDEEEDEYNRDEGGFNNNTKSKNTNNINHNNKNNNHNINNISPNQSLTDGHAAFFQHSDTGSATAAAMMMMMAGRKNSDDELDAEFAQDPSLLEGDVPVSQGEKLAWLEEIEKMEAILMSAVAEAHTTFEEVGGDGTIRDVEQENAILHSRRQIINNNDQVHHSVSNYNRQTNNNYQQQPQQQQQQQQQQQNYERGNSDVGVFNKYRHHSTASSVPNVESSFGSFGSTSQNNPNDTSSIASRGNNDNDNNNSGNNNNNNVYVSNESSSMSSNARQQQQQQQQPNADGSIYADYTQSQIIMITSATSRQNSSGRLREQQEEQDRDHAVIIEETDPDDNTTKLQQQPAAASRPSTTGQTSRDRFELQLALQDQQQQQQQQYLQNPLPTTVTTPLSSSGTASAAAPTTSAPSMNNETLRNNYNNIDERSLGNTLSSGAGSTNLNNSTSVLPQLRTTSPSFYSMNVTEFEPGHGNINNNNNNNGQTHHNSHSHSQQQQQQQQHTIVNQQQLNPYYNVVNPQFLNQPTSSNNSFNTGSDRQGSRLSEMSNVTGTTEAHHRSSTSSRLSDDH